MGEPDMIPGRRPEGKASLLQSVVTLFFSPGISWRLCVGPLSQHVASITPQDRTIFPPTKTEKKIKGKTAQPPFNLRFAFFLSARALSPEHNLLD